MTRATPLALCLLLVACRALPAQETDAAPQAPRPVAPLGPGDRELGLRHGGLDRRYLVHAPAAKADAPRALVLMLHGGGGTPDAMEAEYGMDRVADREGFVVVYPAGTGRLDRRLLTWNAGTCCGWSTENGVDDVGFLRAVVADVSSRLAIDRARVYAAGHSNGGMMAYRLAAEAGDLVTAICSVAGGQVCDPPKATAPAVPVLHIHSVDDPRALWDGGLGPPFPLTNNRVQHPRMADVLATWVNHDRCQANPKTEPKVNGHGGHTAERTTWGGGRDGSEVTLIKLTVAGHGWPGTSKDLPERIVGPKTTVIDASEEAWRFFARFTRRS